MSSNDKAREKLMESMRVTKAGSVNKDEEADTKQNVTATNDKPIKQNKKNVATGKVSKDIQKIAVDPYQSVRRVWPD